MWYSNFIKTSLRKHNLRIDFRVYLGDEAEYPTQSEIESKIKSILSSAIIKGLDAVGIVSRFGIAPGNIAKQQAEQTGIDLKVIPGQDYTSADGYKAVFFNVTEDVPQGLNIQDAIIRAKKNNGKVMLYDLKKSEARAVAGWNSTAYEPDIVEIYNSKSKAYKDQDIDYPRVVSSAARSGSELEHTPIYTELSRKRLEDYGFILKDEGVDFVPKYLQPTQEIDNA